MAFGYVQELISDEIPDPIVYYTDFVAEKNKERCCCICRGLLVHVAFSAPVEYNSWAFSHPYTFRRIKCQRSNRHTVSFTRALITDFHSLPHLPHLHQTFFLDFAFTSSGFNSKFFSDHSETSSGCTSAKLLLISKPPLPL